MEVHHHSHHPKNWREYASEFFMLFFAVFLGFMSEYYLEYRAERHKEHDFMVSLKNDLQSDIININSSLNNADTLRFYSKQMSDLIYHYDKSLEHQIQLYRCGIHIVTNLIDVPFSQGTLNQLKNSGGLRLIRNKDILNAITEYDNAIQILQRQFEGVTERLTEVHAAERPVFYHTLWIQHTRSREIDIDSKSIHEMYTIRGSALLNDQADVLMQLDNAENVHLGYVTFYNSMCLKQKERAIKLLKLIESNIVE